VPLRPHARPPGWLEGLLRSGKLAELARGCATQRELEQRLGITHDAYRKAREQVLHNGRPFPPFHELAGKPAPGALPDFADEERTQPGGFDVSDVLDQEPPTAAESGQTPPGHFEHGRSTLVRDGVPILTWHKTKVSREQHLEQLLAAMQNNETWARLADPVEPPAVADSDLVAVYMMGDPHLGLMTWRKETGADHDLATGERDLVAAIDQLVAVAPAAETGMLVSLGDLVHVDNEGNTTTRGTKQDADSRWFKVMQTTIRTKRQAIERGLRKHKRMLARIIRGNHDWHSAAMIAMALAEFYERDPRVTVEVSPDPFSWFEFGKNLLGWTHTDECNKADDLAGVMAVDQAEAWGRTLYRYMMGGHVHHVEAKETRGVLVERFPTLAPKCSWAHRKGYRAQQSMCVDTYHRKWGRVNRSTVGIRQLRGVA
jgi:hypothetical protein